MRLPFFVGASGPGITPNEIPDADDQASIALLSGLVRESLSPDRATLLRVGAMVRAAFVESAKAPSMRVTRRSWSRRRATFALCAVAILSMTTVGLAAAQSGPGQPLYRLRLGIEAVNLPAAGSQDRLNADLDRADARLDDVAREQSASLWNGAADAADAYVDTISGIVLPSGPAGIAATRRLEGQLARVEQFRSTSQAGETAELDRAIGTVARLLGIPSPIPPGPPTASPRPKTSNGRDTGDTGDTGDTPDSTQSHPTARRGTDPPRVPGPSDSDIPRPRPTQTESNGNGGVPWDPGRHGLGATDRP